MTAPPDPTDDGRVVTIGARFAAFLAKRGSGRFGRWLDGLTERGRLRVFLAVFWPFVLGVVLTYWAG